MTTTNSFGSKATIAVGTQQYEIYRLDALVAKKIGDVATLPYSLRILLENLLRYEDGKTVKPADIEAVAGWAGIPSTASTTRSSSAPRAC